MRVTDEEYLRLRVELASHILQGILASPASVYYVRSLFNMRAHGVDHYGMLPESLDLEETVAQMSGEILDRVLNDMNSK